MLYFYHAPAGQDLDAISDRGLESASDELVLYPSLDAAQPEQDGAVLVVDPHALPDTPPPTNAGPVQVDHVPAEAIQNIDPYRPPAPVTAAGGLIAGQLDDGDVAILLIFRREVWDLPKGKCVAGESMQECAMREVQEEVGIEELTCERPLGTTVHGYENGERYAVKTTHWFLMRTPERSYSPQSEEDIERAAWARWETAREQVGYDTLRRLLDRCEPDVYETLNSRS